MLIYLPTTRSEIEIERALMHSGHAHVTARAGAIVRTAGITHGGMIVLENLHQLPTALEALTKAGIEASG